MPLSPNPLSSLRVSSHQIPAWASFPNTSLHHLPILIYHSAYPASLSASSVESHLSSVGVVRPAWRFSMYRQHHYHSTTHEVLVVTSGAARLCFGGPPEKANTGRVEVVAEKGDVMVVPAGVGHALLEDKGGFEMVGSYPVGAASWDKCTGSPGEKERVWGGIEKLNWFERDPVYGDEGPVLKVGH
ncbi:hypothetical protein IAT38_007914 [Cryptococcus sp. DSM 104549]